LAPAEAWAKIGCEAAPCSTTVVTGPTPKPPASARASAFARASLDRLLQTRCGRAASLSDRLKRRPRRQCSLLRRRPASISAPAPRDLRLRGDRVLRDVPRDLALLVGLRVERGTCCVCNSLPPAFSSAEMTGVSLSSSSGLSAAAAVAASLANGPAETLAWSGTAVTTARGPIVVTSVWLGWCRRVPALGAGDACERHEDEQRGGGKWEEQESSHALPTPAALVSCHTCSTGSSTCRWSLDDPGLGLRQYREAHIPGAVFLDVERDLSAPARAERAATRCRQRLTSPRAASRAGIEHGVFCRRRTDRLGAPNGCGGFFRHFGHEDFAPVFPARGRGAGPLRSGGRDGRAVEVHSARAQRRHDRARRAGGPARRASSSSMRGCPRALARRGERPSIACPARIPGALNATVERGAAVAARGARLAA